DSLPEAVAEHDSFPFEVERREAREVILAGELAESVREEAVAVGGAVHLVAAHQLDAHVGGDDLAQERKVAGVERSDETVHELAVGGHPAGSGLLDEALAAA